MEANGHISNKSFAVLFLFEAQILRLLSISCPWLLYSHLGTNVFDAVEGWTKMNTRLTKTGSISDYITTVHSYSIHYGGRKLE